MHVRPRLSLARPLTALAWAVAAHFTPVNCAAVAQDVSEPAPIKEPALPWNGFKPAAFDGEEVTGTPWKTTIAAPNGSLKYVILGFSEVSSIASGKFRVDVRDDETHLFASYDAAFLAANPRFSTPPLPARTLIVSVVGPAAKDALKFKLDRMLTAYTPTVSKSLIPNLQVYSGMNATERQLGRGVAKLIIADTEVCTGFLVAQDTLVTNNHCLRSSASYAKSAGQAIRACGDITIAFDYSVDPYTRSGNPKCVAVAKAIAVPVDIAILKLDKPPPNVAGRVYTLADHDVGNAPETAQVYEHPWGLPLGLVKNCAVKGVGAGAAKLEHTCSTLGGASGSPILNGKGEVVGIHSNGFIADGATSIEVMETYYQACNAGACPTNKGTPASQIRGALKD